MPKDVPAQVQTLLNNGMGMESVNIVRIYWNHPTFTEYSDREIEGQNVRPSILSLGNIDSILDIAGGTSSSSLSLTLDDYDDMLRKLLNTNKIYKAKVEVYQYFIGLDYSTKFLIFTGEVTSPVEWSEGERTLTVQIESSIKSTTVAYSPEEGQYAYIQPELIGNVWPLCFGSPIHVPAVLANTTRTGQTGSYFSIPDPLLWIKRKLVDLAIENLIENRKVVLSLINKVKNLVDSAQSLQQQYASAILAEDKNKQLREDLIKVITDMNTQVQEALNEYEGAQTPTNLASYQKHRDTRDLKVLELAEASRLMDEAVKDKKRIEHDISVLRYAFSAEGKCREKLATIENDYKRLTEQRKLLDQLTLTQVNSTVDKVLVTNGEYFPQNVEIRLLINNQLIRGMFNNRTFMFSGLEPTYRNVPCGLKLDDDLNTFYVTDQTLRLSNTYALLPSGLIIRIMQQSGLKCSFELVEQRDKRTITASYADSDNKYMKKAREGLSNILTGNETDEDMIDIIESIPKDICIQIWKQLVAGPANKQILRVDYSPGGGSFKLVIDGVETEDIPYNASSKTIKDVLSRSPWIYARKKDNNDVAVEPVSTTVDDDISKTPMLISFANRCLPMPVISTKNEDLVAKSNKIKFGLINYDGSSQMSCKLEMPNGDVTTSISSKATAQDIEKILLNTSYFKPGDVKVNGSYLGVPGSSYVIIEWLRPIKGRIKIKNQTKVDSGEFVISGFLEGLEPCASIYTYSEGAHEHTLGEIENKIKNAIENSQYKKPLTDLKKNIKDLMSSIDPNDWKTSKDAWDTFQEVGKYIRQYTKLLSHLGLPDTLISEAYRVISDSEYSHLFDCEILNWMSWRRSITPVSEEIKTQEQKYCVTGKDILGLAEVSATILPSWVTKFVGYDREKFIDEASKLPESQSVNFDVGEQVTLELDYQEKYVCNLLPSTIKAVYAYRSVNGLKSLVPVPKSYYIKNENEQYGPYNLTTITLYRPLGDYTNEYWEDGLYVTLQSSVGPNVCDIISWILTKYTNLSHVDFTSIKSKLEKYPANFAVLDRQDALDLCKSIAWQSRCALWVKQGVIGMKYLSEDPVSTDTLTESDINFNSLVLSTTNSMDIVTKFVAIWQPHYAVTKPNKQIIRGNIPRYNEVAEEHNFFIYNDYDLVAKSATFWFIRRSNIFKTISFSTSIHKIGIEVFDDITLALENNLICNGSVIGQVTKADYDSASGNINFEVWLPVLIGQQDKFKFAFPSSVSIYDLFPSTEIIVSGNAGNPINQYAPSGVPVNPSDDDLLYIRPIDYGKRLLSDLQDKVPSNPANEYAEVDPPNQEDQEITGMPTLTDLADNTVNETDLLEFNNYAVGSFGIKDEFFIGTVESINTIQNQLAIVDGPETSIQYYNVRSTSGNLYKVRQMQIHKDDRIPPNTVTLVIYDKTANEYQMQVPVYIGEYSA